MMQMDTFKVVFKGIVQGVGFRQTIYHIALKSNLVGYVKNLPDGRVELIVVTDEMTLEHLLIEIKNKAKAALVENIDIQKLIPLEEFTNFSIRKN